jgi:hypothetical protein
MLCSCAQSHRRFASAILAPGQPPPFSSMTFSLFFPLLSAVSLRQADITLHRRRFVGTKVEFGADTDEIALDIVSRELPLTYSDPYLNKLLQKDCEAALALRKGDVSQLRTRVENAISALLPHGRVPVENVARDLGMSRRTLARKLSEEGLNFT